MAAEFCSSDDDSYSQEYDDDYEYEDYLRDIEPADTQRGSSIKVINQETLLAAQKEDLSKVMDLLLVKEHHARTLLIHHRWDVGKILAVFVEDGRDKLCREAGVALPECDELLDHRFGDITCNICYDEVCANRVTTMDCGHTFCNDCWTEHFIVKINEGQSRRIKCMAPGCNAICDDLKTKQLVRVRDPVLADKFDRFISESYVEDNARVKWCPSLPHCGNAIRVEDNEVCEVECACGLQFCFGCSSEVHSPASCLMWQLWTKKCKEESETVNWLTANTKPCPKCYKTVEKNGGCNLVFCVCGQSFCWLCGEATGRNHTWTAIFGHSCGRYKDANEMNSTLARKYLDRYIHFFNRYKAHSDSFKLESKLKETVEDKICVLEDQETRSKDFSWITNGLQNLFRCRRFLANSYAFAYYFFGHELFRDETRKRERVMKQNLFEDIQQQFEGNIEKLSMALEEDFEGFSLNEERLEFKMRAATTDTLCRNLYEYIESELLSCLKSSVHRIVPYKSGGVEKASPLLL